MWVCTYTNVAANDGLFIQVDEPLGETSRQCTETNSDLVLLHICVNLVRYLYISKPFTLYTFGREVLQSLIWNISTHVKKWAFVLLCDRWCQLFAICIRWLLPVQHKSILSRVSCQKQVSNAETSNDIPTHAGRSKLTRANHYNKFQWKQSRRIAGALQWLSSRLSGLITSHIYCTWYLLLA